MTKWLEGEGLEKDVIVSSRIRLARNLRNIKFPYIMDNNEAIKVINAVKEAIDSNLTTRNDFLFYRVNELSPLKRRIYAEKYLISIGLLEKPDKSAFLLKKDEKATIMINEEDHIRIQVILPGLNLKNTWELCTKIDDIIEGNVDYAFDEKFGYLTVCPTNTGTGLRASVMMHLPALVKSNYINNILHSVAQLGLTVRGLYGEGTNALGNLFQISNQTTLGLSEEEIIRKLENIVLQIINKERMAREQLLANRKIEIEDKIYRSLGILKNARLMSLEESMEKLSDISLGIDLNIIKGYDKNIINDLMIKTQTANIQGLINSNFSIEKINYKRAEIIRDKLTI